MPHLQLEYTKNIQTIIHPVLFEQLFSILNTVAEISLANCKSRSIQINDYQIGSGNHKIGFVHLEIKILEGREIEIRNKIGRDSMEIMKLYFKEFTTKCNIQYSIEILEMKKEDYFTSNNII
tara:strand:- start:27 stop:392 length:366 start_codon:yes stop_codon:yes gene_type:complete